MLPETPVFLFCLIYGVTVLSPLFKLIIVLFTAATFHFVGKYTYVTSIPFHYMAFNLKKTIADRWCNG